VTILTAGYGNRGFAAFIELMKQHGVTHLVDVRSVPQSSYWEDFRRERLTRIVPETGLKYVYMGDTLGGTPVPDPVQAAALTVPAGDEAQPVPDGKVKPPIFCKTDPAAIDLHPLFHDPKFRLGLTKLVEAAMVPGRSICLMCGCLRPHKCHRSRLIGAALTDEGVDVLHLDQNGEPLSHLKVVEESIDPQVSLF